MQVWRIIFRRSSYDLRDARRDCYTASQQKQKKHGGSTCHSIATSESDLPENQIPAAVFKGCPISLAVHPPARSFPYVVSVFCEPARAHARVSRRWPQSIPRNLLAARSSARLSPYMMPVSRAYACVSKEWAGHPQSPRGTLVGLIIPVCVLCLVAGTKIVREFFKDRGAVALALCFAVETAIE